MEQPITLKIFDNYVEAHLLKSKLESEGIACFLFDENLISLNPIYSNLLGGIKIKVFETDLNGAELIIKEIENTPLTSDTNHVIKCPNCDSIYIETGHKSFKGVKGVFSAFLSFLFLIFPIYFKRVYKCKSCGLEFEEKK